MNKGGLVEGTFDRTIAGSINLDTKFEMKSSSKDGFAGLILLCKITLNPPPP
jgi:hypothetical protein